MKNKSQLWSSANQLYSSSSLQQKIKPSPIKRFKSSGIDYFSSFACRDLVASFRTNKQKKNPPRDVLSWLSLVCWLFFLLLFFLNSKMEMWLACY